MLGGDLDWAAADGVTIAAAKIAMSRIRMKVASGLVDTSWRSCIPLVNDNPESGDVRRRRAAAAADHRDACFEKPWQPCGHECWRARIVGDASGPSRRAGVGADEQ